MYRSYLFDKNQVCMIIFQGKTKQELIEQIVDRNKVLTKRFPNGPEWDFESIIITEETIIQDETTEEFVKHEISKQKKRLTNNG